MWLKVRTVNSCVKKDCVCIHYISSNRERSLNSNPPQIAVTRDIVIRSCPCFTKHRNGHPSSLPFVIRDLSLSLSLYIYIDSAQK